MASSPGTKKLQPIIIKRVKKAAHAHHGGAWKIAYADFVTAMMAFFLLMWLLGSTAKGDLQGIASYFQSPLQVAMPGGSGAGNSSSIIPGGGTEFRSVPLAAMDPAATYTTYKVTFNYQAASTFNTRKDDSIFAFINEPEPITTNAHFFADPGPSPFIDQDNSQAHYQPGPMVWYGAFWDDTVRRSSNGTVIETGGRANLLPGSSPLHFDYGQVGAYSATTWSNVTITLNDRPLNHAAFSGTVDNVNGPRWDRFFDTQNESATSNTRKNVAYDFKPFYVDTTGIYQISTATDPVSNGTGSQWYAYLGIYAEVFDPAQAGVNLLATDGTIVGGYLDQPNIIGIELEAGRQYYLVQTQRLTNSRGGVYTGMVHGEGNLTFGTVPEPSASLAAILPGALLVRRRRVSE